MDDMAQKIQNLLNDEESMGQIMKLAQMLGGSEASSSIPDLSSIFGQSDPPPQNNQNNAQNNQTNNSYQQSNNMTANIKRNGQQNNYQNQNNQQRSNNTQANGNQPNQYNNNQQNSSGTQSNSMPDFDMSKIAALAQLMQKANQHDPNTDFLLALKPLLKEESQQKLSKITKIFKLMAVWPVIKESGLLGGDLFDVL